MLLFTHTNTPRLQYVADFVSCYFETSLTITTDAQQFGESKGACINYSDTDVPGHSTWIRPTDLLFRNDIVPVDTGVFTHPAGYKALFETDGGFGFDLFSGIFYLLSRYEEYLPHQKDSYGRYAHEESIAFRESFLDKPLINIWLQDLGKKLLNSFPGVPLKAPRYQFKPTYDIDIAWSYRNKGFVRNSGGLARSIFRGQWSSVTERVKVLARRKKDPFDSYEWMDELHRSLGLQPIFFFHVGHRRNRYDRNITIRNANFQELIRNMSQKYTVGLHPSWHSGDDPSYLIKEKKFLDGIVRKDIKASRQHYIRLTLPCTYQQLLAAGIREDYTMGYGTANGFRASVASSFYWYHLEKEEATPLLIHPFCYMDANALYEQKQTPDEAGKEMLHYHEQVKAVGGTFITVWHNPFLGRDPFFAGWKEKYSEALGVISAS